MRLTVLLFALLLAGQAAGPAEPGPAAGRSSLTTTGIVDAGNFDSNGIWFSLSQIDQRFVLVTNAVVAPDALFEALRDSNKSGRSVHVTFDVESGIFEGTSDTPSYIVRRIEYDGRTYSGMQGVRPKYHQSTPQESALARGVAFYSAGVPAKALAALDAALSGGKLRPSLNALALETRGNAITEAILSSRQNLTADDERQFISALEDFRAWAALEPDSMQAQTAIAYVLRDLGAYEEALEIFGTFDQRWPDEKLQTATRIGSTYRIMGEHGRALAVLDDLVAREGPQDGMKFHYHRGWTLNSMGRFAEAAAEFTEGLKTQPDYSWALIKRACAHAQLGLLADALADMRAADELWRTRLKQEEQTPMDEYNHAWATAVATQLEEAIARGDKTPASSPCTGDWSAGDLRRERSPLLPARAPVS